MSTARSKRVLPLATAVDTLVRAIEAAEERGESRYALAKRTGVSQATLSRIVNRQTESVSLDTMERLLDALGIEIRIKKR